MWERFPLNKKRMIRSHNCCNAEIVQQEKVGGWKIPFRKGEMVLSKKF